MGHFFFLRYCYVYGTALYFLGLLVIDDEIYSAAQTESGSSLLPCLGFTLSFLFAVFQPEFKKKKEEVCL